MEAEQSDTALVITEKDQLFPEYFEGLWDVIEVSGSGYRDPVTPKPLASSCSRSNTG
jgi:hypothetical protein